MAKANYIINDCFDISVVSANILHIPEIFILLLHFNTNASKS